VCERGVEAVTAHDLVEVGGGDRAGVHEGIQAIYDELRTLETEHGRNCKVVLGIDMLK
jgi:hypothetical protein